MQIRQENINSFVRCFGTASIRINRPPCIHFRPTICQRAESARRYALLQEILARVRHRILAPPSLQESKRPRHSLHVATTSLYAGHNPSTQSDTHMSAPTRPLMWAHSTSIGADDKGPTDASRYLLLHAFST